jgi:hypothetical protein
MAWARTSGGIGWRRRRWGWRWRPGCYFYRCQPISCGPVTQCAEIVSPTFDRATGQQRTRMVTASADRCRVGDTGHRHRRQPISCGPVTQLTVAISAPTFDRATRQQRTRMLIAGTHGGSWCWRYWWRRRRGRRSGSCGRLAGRVPADDVDDQVSVAGVVVQRDLTVATDFRDHQIRDGLTRNHVQIRCIRPPFTRRPHRHKRIGGGPGHRHVHRNRTDTPTWHTAATCHLQLGLRPRTNSTKSSQRQERCRFRLDGGSRLAVGLPPLAANSGRLPSRDRRRRDC